jgi:hypothetical protein
VPSLGEAILQQSIAHQDPEGPSFVNQMEQDHRMDELNSRMHRLEQEQYCYHLRAIDHDD